MIKYGLISETDAKTLEATIDLIIEDNPNELLYITEVGCYAGQSASGLSQYIKSKGKDCFIVGIDNGKDGEELRFKYDRFIKGNSNEVYNQLKDDSQDLIIIDALHTFPAVISDFFCYAPKIKVGGFIAFHDSGKHLDPLSHWQGVGDKNDPDMCIGGVRRALNKIGLIVDIEQANESINRYYNECELIFDEADPNDTGGGFCVFKKL